MEKVFLHKRCPYLDPVYLDFLEGYRYDPHEVKISQNECDLKVIIEGPWYRTIYWEVPLMALISEQYYISTDELQPPALLGLGRGLSLVDEKILKKREQIRSLGVPVSDFGTRRRYSFDNHQHVISRLADTITGTSNVYLAMIHNLKAIGTVAHEWIMAMGALYGFKMANRIAMENWIKAFGGDLGIALSDTYTTNVFLRSFDKKFAKLFDGVRQDSGSPFNQAAKIIKHYESLGIDPKTKSIIFSDSLNLDMVKEIHEFCGGRIKDAYGIGTNLTNDVGVKPLNIVIKMTGVEIDGQWTPTVKLSDSNGKNTGDSSMVQLCKGILRIE
jgi:nicotinate phosphoribosyltransferase